MTRDLISIIIPAFRAESFIRRAVTSVLAQTALDWELVIASDDGQDYHALLKNQGITDARLRSVATGAIGGGTARARNCALDAARGTLIASLDADDAFMPSHLERMVPLAAQHGLAICQVEFIDHESGQHITNNAKMFPSGLLPLDQVLLACLHTYAPIVFNRAKIPNRWNERISLLEDAVFLAEAYNHVPMVWYESGPSYRYFRRLDSVANSDAAARRFLEAGKKITRLLARGGIGIANPRVRTVLEAYIERNNDLEMAFEKALTSGQVSDYQQFIDDNLATLHAPLV
jgi:succinoglycan biosynthesis protein ExoO